MNGRIIRKLFTLKAIEITGDLEAALKDLNDDDRVELAELGRELSEIATRSMPSPLNLKANAVHFS